jgi:hypothetical protein
MKAAIDTPILVKSSTVLTGSFIKVIPLSLGWRGYIGHADERIINFRASPRGTNFFFRNAD